MIRLLQYTELFQNWPTDGARITGESSLGRALACSQGRWKERMLVPTEKSWKAAGNAYMHSAKSRRLLVSLERRQARKRV